MALYCGIDLHSNNLAMVVSDERDDRVVDRIGPNQLDWVLNTLEPIRDELRGMAVESTYNWYWLVDGLQADGYDIQLVNPVAAKQYSGLKYTDDRHDAAWIAHMLRLGILPTGTIHPKAWRRLRDLLRCRLSLVRLRVRESLCLQNQWARETGGRLSAQQLRRRLDELGFEDPYVDWAWQAHARVWRALEAEITTLEQVVRNGLQDQPGFAALQSVTGIGPMLAMTIILETGDIGRFRRVQNYASYCRCVRAERFSNNKSKGENNRRNGNRYLSWAYSEAAHFAVRYDLGAQRFYQRKRRKSCALVAIRAVAHKLVRACFYILRDGVRYESERLFGAT